LPHIPSQSEARSWREQARAPAGAEDALLTIRRVMAAELSKAVDLHEAAALGDNPIVVGPGSGSGEICGNY